MVESIIKELAFGKNETIFSLLKLRFHGICVRCEIGDPNENYCFCVRVRNLGSGTSVGHRQPSFSEHSDMTDDVWGQRECLHVPKNIETVSLLTANLFIYCWFEYESLAWKIELTYSNLHIWVVILTFKWQVVHTGLAISEVDSFFQLITNLRGAGGSLRRIAQSTSRGQTCAKGKSSSSQPQNVWKDSTWNIDYPENYRNLKRL